jgi:cell division protein FtsL
MLARRREDYYYEEQQPQKNVPYRIKKPSLLLNWHLRSRCCMLLIVLSIMAMVVTVRNSISASRGYELVQIQQEAVRLEKENERLKIDIAHMKSPQRIKAIATQKLGMVVPETVYFASERHK